MDISSTTSNPGTLPVDLTARNGAYSSQILRICLDRARTDGTHLFQAFVDYCEDNDTDADDVYQWLDKNAKEQIRLAALENNMVRKCVAVAPDALEFD